MKLLLLACLTVRLCLCTALALPAPEDLYMSSVNFRHVLHWTAAPGSPPGLNYHVYIRCLKKPKEVANITKTWAVVRLPRYQDRYRLCVRSRFNMTFSPWSKPFFFTPYLQTNITPPNVTLSGCGTCIQMNISLPEVHQGTRIRDIREIYKGLSFNLSVRRQGQDTVIFTETSNQTLVIPHLIPGTEYCVQVKLHYLTLIFEPSSWTCVLTSPAHSSVFPVVVSVAVLVVVSLLAVLLVLLALQYTGVICKLKEALPHTLITSLTKHSLLSLERTCPEPVSLPPRPDRPQHSPSVPQQEDQQEDGEEDQQEDGEEDQEEDGEEDQEEDQQEDLYMDRGADLSSDSSLRCGHVTTSSQSAATVTDHSGSPTAGLDEQEEEKEQMMKADDRMTKGSLDCKEVEEWHKELEKDESVNLFSVTIGALDGSCEEEESDELLLLHMPCHTLLPQQTQDTDLGLADLQAEGNYYMRHQL